MLTVATLSLSACGGGGAIGTSAQATAESATTTAVTSNTGSNTTPTTATGSNGSTGATSSTSTSTSATDIPVISGVPASTASAGKNYTFKPAASGPRGAQLSFAIENGPIWSHFNTSTGELWGTPTSRDVGNYPDIRISVSNGRAKSSLPPFSLIVPRVVSGLATISWIPPAKNSDGTPLVDLAGFEILYGQSTTALSQKIKIGNASTNRYTIQPLSAGSWYFAVIAVNSKGVGSNMSSVMSKTI